MSTFDENKHERDGAGKFAPKDHQEAHVDLLDTGDGRSYDAWDLAQGLNDKMEFDCPVTITEDGELVRPDDVYAPEVTGEDLPEGWEWVDGFSGQQDYSGPLMHRSEFIGGGMAEHIAENPGTYVVVVVECDHDGCDASEEDVENGDAQCEPDSWAVLRKIEDSPDPQDPDLNTDVPQSITEDFYGNGQVATRYRFDSNGQPHDGPNGEPAVQSFHPDGSISNTSHFQHGKFQDTPDGTPAYQDFYKNGSPLRSRRHTDGKINDGPNGEPAIEVWAEDGTYQRVEHYKDDLANNGPNGAPAVTHWPKGGSTSPAERIEYHTNGIPTNGPNGEPAILTRGRGLAATVGYLDNNVPNDAPDGTPAFQSWDENGNPSAVYRYRNGEFNDGPNGEPAVTTWSPLNDGPIFTHYRDGVLIEDAD